MRRFFLGRSKDKDKDKDKRDASGAGGPGPPATAGAKGQHSDAAKQVDLDVFLARSGQSPQLPAGGAPQSSRAGPSALSTSEAQQTPQPPKQVAFGTVESHPPADDVQSLASRHGALNIACFPTRAVSASPGAPAGTSATNANSSGATNHAKQHIPSQPVRNVSLDNGKDATVRPSNPGSPVRGDIPRFADGIGLGLAHLDGHEGAMRSATSMSHSTTASTSSFGSQHHHVQQRQNAFYTNQAANYPNLAILATYARDANAASGGNGIMQHLTWSEITDDELVENLGGRERTRQEVLFEMVCSEERYVQELITLRDNYLDPLLGRQVEPTSPMSTMRSISSASRSHLAPTVKSTESLDARRPLLDIPANTVRAVSAQPASGTVKTALAAHSVDRNSSADHLPIAARFARRTSLDQGAGLASSLSSTRSHPCGSSNDSSAGQVGHGTKSRDASGGTNVSGTTAVDSGEDTDSSNVHYGNANSGTRNRLVPLFMNTNTSKTHTIASEAGHNSSSTHVGTINIPRVFKHHLKSLTPPPPNKLHKANDGQPGIKDLPLVIPEDLRRVCVSILDHLLGGHQSLSAKLRARYEEQFPLVRTLADVFADQGWVIEHYTTYVLHLEKALQDIEETLQIVNPMFAAKIKKSKDKEEIKEQKRLAKAIMRLEEQAAMKGHPGLSICLSQPFQRLLKYPLLFQSLLYHTDPSTRDYDATQKLAIEIDAVVRSIENEKVSEEERAKTRDCWARIEGVSDKTLLSPRSGRLLVAEEAMWATPAPGLAAARRTFSDAGRNLKSVDEAQAEAVAGKKSARRLSDFVPGGHAHEADKTKKQPSIGSKRDVWLVSFTDVVIRCQRVGVTKLPLGSEPGSKANKRAVTLLNKERNLYKFLKIDHWVMEDQTSSRRAGVVSMEQVARSRRSARIDEDPLTESEAEQAEEEAGGTSGNKACDNGGESRMSFTYATDEPRPAFDVDPLIGLTRTPSMAPYRKPAKQVRATASPTTQQVVRKQGTAAAKFSNRVRPSVNESPTPPFSVTGSASSRAQMRSISPGVRENQPLPQGTPRGDRTAGFSKPTAASKARAAANAKRIEEQAASLLPEPKRVRAVSSGASSSKLPPASPQQTPRASRVRRSSFSEVVGSDRTNGTQQLRTKHSSERLGHRRQGSDIDSGVALYNQFWKGDDLPQPR